MTLNAHALVIGASQYRHIRRLPLVADATDLASVLRDPTASGFDPANVTLLHESEATRARIIDALDRLVERAGPDSTALVYFSGHGGRVPDNGGESYLMPIDSEWSAPDYLAATAISSQLLGDKLAAIPAERLAVVLDCRHAGGPAQPRDAAAGWRPELADVALDRLAAGRGRIVMAASRDDSRSHGAAGARYGLFTEHLIAGLRGAIGSTDGVVRVLDLCRHVQRNVAARLPDQQPVLKGALENNYAIARSSRSAGPAPVAAAFAYDLLVVYAPGELDRSWAVSTLVRQLEDRGLRVCIEDRDAGLGQMRLLEIERLVTTSRFTLPVLTPRFAAGRLQELQTLMAQQLGLEDGLARLIPIVREPCDARLGLRVLVHLDMIRDEKIAPGIDRLVKTLRTTAAS